MTLTRRQIYRSGLNSLYLPIYDGLCNQLGPDWQPYIGVRSSKQQEDLYAIGRTVPGANVSPEHLMGDTVTNAKPDDSPHNYGCATDWCLWDEKGNPYWPPISHPRWKEFEQACAKAGAGWGGHFHTKDGPHAELSLKVSWKKVGEVFADKGLDTALAFIRENIA